MMLTRLRFWRAVLAAASLAATPAATPPEKAAMPAAVAPAAAPPPPAAWETLLEQGHEAYYRGDQAKAVEFYAKAAAASTTTVKPWLNGGAALEELGRPADAARWYARAAALSAEPDVLSALGWAQWRARSLQAADATFQKTLERDPAHPYALLGAARAALDAGRPRDAAALLEKAARAAPLLNLVPYYQGQAYEAMGDTERAVAAFREAVIGDSFFEEGRDALGRALLRQRSYNEAWRQFSKILDVEPKSRRVQAVVRKLQPLLTRRPGEIRRSSLRPIPYLAPSEEGAPGVPMIRVGIGVNALGRPRARPAVAFKCTSDFDVIDAATGKRLASGEAEAPWRARVKRAKKRRLIVLADASGRTILERKEPFLVKPRSASDGAVSIDDAARVMRGAIELSLFKGNLRVVNIVDLETYTHGVVASEMPIRSPIEALKAQAIIARSHALFIKRVTRRHRREGYDVCDDQHCQVYMGLLAESKRSRDVVDSTRGMIATYDGKVAHVIYSSNCGGFTQSGRDVPGWGDVPYWTSVPDGRDLIKRPRGPWELSQWLKSWPQAYCRPSNDVHPSHFRWSRVVSLRDLEEKMNRKLRVGRLKGVRALRRSASGNVNALLVMGSRRNAKVTNEMDIRGLLGVGSLRSTLFVVETEYDASGKPQAFVFHGGGWGHAVGLCQSGAMGRADAGQSAEEIIKAYFQGTELGRLDYGG